MPTVDIEDKVTLLSYKEVKDIFPTKEQRRIKPTEYTKKHGANSEYVEYWLLSTGRDDNSMAIINRNGDPDSRSVTDAKGIVPKITISLSFGLEENAGLTREVEQ